MPNEIAPLGKIWVCTACGKTSRDEYGFSPEHSYGWDESCTLHAKLFDVAKLVRVNGLVTEVLE